MRPCAQGSLRASPQRHLWGCGDPRVQSRKLMHHPRLRPCASMPSSARTTGETPVEGPKAHLRDGRLVSARDSFYWAPRKIIFGLPRLASEVRDRKGFHSGGQGGSGIFRDTLLATGCPEFPKRLLGYW